MEGKENSPIAIVGMSCRFAGAESLEAFWRLIMEQQSSFTQLSPEVALPHGGKNLFGGTFPTYGAQLGKLYSCVPRSITFPRQINSGENQDLYFAVQLAFEALFDAGMRPHSPVPVKGTVRFGYAPLFNPAVVNWLQHTFFMDQALDILHRFFPNAPEESMAEVRNRLVESLPAPNSDSFLTAAGHRMADWVAGECGFNGDASTLDAGIMSFISCCQQGMDDLRSGRADVALVGAMMPPLSRAFLQGFSANAHFASGSSLTPFDTESAGTLPGEGGAFFVLKRRADALRSRDRIYALIRSTAVESGASGSSALSTAASLCGADIKSIRLIEADGSGVVEADNEELRMISGLWGNHEPGRPLVAVGSVKGNVGHCMRASAAAGAVKMACALRNKVLPPQMPSSHVLEDVARLESSVYILNEARPWVSRNATSPRRAAVLASNFTGRKAAMIMEEEPEDRK